MIRVDFALFHINRFIRRFTSGGRSCVYRTTGFENAFLLIPKLLYFLLLAIVLAREETCIPHHTLPTGIIYSGRSSSGIFIIFFTSPRLSRNSFLINDTQS